jgi:hypothetical protein
MVVSEPQAVTYDPQFLQCIPKAPPSGRFVTFDHTRPEDHPCRRPRFACQCGRVLQTADRTAVFGSAKRTPIVLSVSSTLAILLESQAIVNQWFVTRICPLGGLLARWMPRSQPFETLKRDRQLSEISDLLKLSDLENGQSRAKFSYLLQFA